MEKNNKKSQLSIFKKIFSKKKLPDFLDENIPECLQFLFGNNSMLILKCVIFKFN